MSWNRLRVRPKRLAVNNHGTSLFLREDGAFSPAFSPVGVLRSPLSASTAQQISSNVAHWCYVGYLPSGLVIKRVVFVVSTLAVGTQAAEVCVATGVAPTGSTQTLTKLWANGTLDDMTVGTGVKGNTVDNTIPLAANSHVYLGVRCAFTGGGATQPSLHIVQRDWGRGFLGQTSSAGVLTSGSSWTLTPVTFANNTSTDIRGYL